MKKSKANGRIIDADGHIRETDAEIIEFMSPGYRARRDAMLYFPLTPHHGWHRSIPANDFRQQDFRVPDWREWVTKLDEGGFESTVLYPTRLMHIGQIGNPTYAVELCRAYNDYLHESFLSHDRRFRGMALLPLQDPSAAVKELRRAVRKYGMVGGILPAEGLALPLGHRQFWPVFKEADKLGCALSIHSCNSLRDNDRYLQPNEAATLTHIIPQMRQFTNIMFSGLLNNLKKLRLGFLEAGCGWVPFLISKIEERLERVAPSERPVLPSELLARKQLFFQCGEEMTTKRDVELLGDDCLLWASDFPHEATRTDMKKLVNEHFARKDLSTAAKKKIIYDNAKRFYAL
ncbi:MAG TPA: amidohydrolase family protein [Candidatus Binatus sp.]|nr:amidohydrolase family protein [Candidatus Binatus sp.]